MSSTISNTARSGNVLVLLDLYASGFASATASPTIPMLTSRTMHALYAVSLLIYTLNSLFNWIHVYVVLQGFLTSFPLHFWFILLLVVSSVSGTMLILLLMVWKCHFPLKMDCRRCSASRMPLSIDWTLLNTRVAWLSFGRFHSFLEDSISHWRHLWNGFRVLTIFASAFSSWHFMIRQWLWPTSFCLHLVAALVHKFTQCEIRKNFPILRCFNGHFYSLCWPHQCPFAGD